MTFPLLEKRWPGTIPIIDGKITLDDHDLGVRYVISVKQVKGKGVADADYLTLVNEYHRELLQIFTNMQDGTTFTGQQIRGWIQAVRDSRGDKREFKPANWIRTISEIYRKGIITYSTKSHTGAYIYKLDKTKAMQALELGRFQ